MEDLPEVRLIRADGRVMGGDTKWGGRPTLVCGDVHDECCGQAMALLGQFDAIDYPEMDWPGRALVYVFVCTKCFAFSLIANAPDH
jgi:hypothetical protein